MFGANVNGGGYTNDFAVQPAAADFSTRAFGSTGTAGPGEIQTVAALDAAVQTNSAALIISQCASSTGNPPNPAAGAVWASGGRYLQTRPNANAATLLMATLVNNTGSDGTGARILYSYTNRTASSAEQIVGHRVFYSLSGAANSWSLIPALSQTASGTLNANLIFPELWPGGGRLYLLWTDDNGSPSPDDALNIDNFFVEVTGTGTSCLLLSPATGESFAHTNAVRFSAIPNAGSGAVVSGVGFYETSTGLIGSAFASPYAFDAIFSAGVYSAYAIVTNSLGAIAFSATNTFTVTNVPFSVALLSPTNGITHGTPTNIALVASAYAGNDATITGVGFFEVASGPIASASAAPYSVNVDFGGGTFAIYAVASNSLGAILISTTNTMVVHVPPTNMTAPTIFAVTPTPGTSLTNLTNVTVTFSEPVAGVNATDLLINGVPAAAVAGDSSNYVFMFPQPSYGQVAFTWAANHGITDIGWPGQFPFDANAEGATWSYQLIDLIRPTLASRTPGPIEVVPALSQISVTFSENVTGVDATDLLINSVPASEVAGSGSNYTFSVAQPVTINGPITIAVTWAGNHGIADLAANTFNGPSWAWNFTLDVRTILIQSNAFWRFVKGTSEPSVPSSAWRSGTFDAAGWSNAAAPFFFGDPYSNGLPAFTHLSDMESNYSTIFLRGEFVATNVGSITNLLLNLQIDDGALVWLNGVNVLRVNAPGGETPYNATAPAAANEPQNSGAAYVSFILTNAATGALVDGTNVLAVHALNQATTANNDFGFNAQLYTYLPNFSGAPPRITQVIPPPGEISGLTRIIVTFSENVTGVNAADLLVNGVPAATVSNTNTTYTFQFPQPEDGPVAITWDTIHDIADLDEPPKAFDGTATNAVFQYSLVNPNAPVVASRAPAPGTVNVLTNIDVTFNKPVTGVDPGDLLVNGIAATQITGGGADYAFGFAQPAYGAVAITWALNSGIQDNEANKFDGTRPTNKWLYMLQDRTGPTVASQIPAADAFVPSLSQVEVTFSEPVSGVNAADLRINGVAATGVSGSNATYTFTCALPNATSVNVTWASNHGIVDRAAPPNAFNASSWSYTTADLVGPSIRVDPPPLAIVKNLTRINVYFDEPVNGVTAGDLLINNIAAQGVIGTGAGPYAFTFSRPPTGAVDVAFASEHGIQDLAAPPNAFAGAAWTYTLNPAIPAAIAVTHVVQISLDGLGAIYLQSYLSNAPAEFPNFVRLMNEAAFTMNARCDYEASETVPNHTTMFTGRPVGQPAGFPLTTHHGYSNNFPTAAQTFHNSGNPNVPYKASMFDVAHDYGRTTAFYAGKTRLEICDRSFNAVNGGLDLIAPDNGRDKIDFSVVLDIQGAAIVEQVDTLIADLTSANPRQYIFIHIAEPDLTGHGAGWGSTTWSNMVRLVDAQIGRIINAIDTNPALQNQTALIVTADHGGGGTMPNGHTDATHFLNYTIPFFLRAPGISGGMDLYDLFSNRADPGTNRTDYTTHPQPIRNGDGSNLALSLMALPPIPGSFMVPTFATASVTLHIARFQDQISVFWPDPNDQYDLEAAAVLNGTQWQTITTGIATNETTKVYGVSAAHPGPRQFFRLRKK